MDRVAAGGVSMMHASMHASLIAATLVSTTVVRADSLWLGLQLGNPGTGSGLPLAGTQFPFGLLGRYERPHWPVLAGGVGTTVAGVGISGWLGAELRLPVTTRFGLLATPGLRIGLVGVGYYARHSSVFVGYEYNYAGPWTVAPRLPLGVSLRLGRAEVFSDAFFEVPIWPSPDLLVGAELGVRVQVW